MAAQAVRSHENEHVVHNAQNAEEQGMTAHSTVTIHMAACPDCGRLYVSGGTTRTTYSRKPAVDTGSAKGTYVDTEI